MGKRKSRLSVKVPCEKKKAATPMVKLESPTVGKRNEGEPA